MKYNIELTDYEARTVLYILKEFVPDQLPLESRGISKLRCFKWRSRTRIKVIQKLQCILLVPTIKKAIEKRKEKK